MSWILEYFVDYGAAATAVQRKACRAAAAYAAFDAATAAAAASALLLLSCCCAAAELLYLSHRGTSSPCSYQNMMLAVLRNANRSFLFSIRDLYFCDLTEFRRFAHRKHIQSDAGMNLAFFKFDRIIGWTISLYLLKKH